MDNRIKNPGVFGKSIQEAKESIDSAIEKLEEHNQINNRNSRAYRLSQDLKWAKDSLPDASKRTHSQTKNPIEQLNNAVKNLENAYSQAQVLTGDPVVDNSFGHIRRATDYLHEATQQIEQEESKKGLMSRISQIFN